MICLSVSRSPHASARPSSVASISTRRACATSLKHSSPCPPRPTASPPPTSPLGCAFSANKTLFRTAPATLPTISKNSAANRSFSGSPALAGTTHSRPAFAQSPPSWCFATKPSNPCSLPLNLSAQLAARTTRDPSTPTTVSYRWPCTASFTSSALPLEYRQFFCRDSPLSAYNLLCCGSAARLSSEVFAVGQCDSLCRRQDCVPGAGRDALVLLGLSDGVDRVEALLDALQLLAQQPPQHDDAGIRMRQVFERVDRDRALPLLRFEIVGLALALLVAAFQERARPDVGDRVGPRLPVGFRLAILKRPGDDADAAHMLVVDRHGP